MNDQPCKYIGCPNEAQPSARSCYVCERKYAGVNPKPSSHPKVNKWRKINGRYKNIQRKPLSIPEPREESKDYIQIFKENRMNEALEEARKNKPKSQLFEEKLSNYQSQKNYNDGLKQYSRFAEIDTVGPINLPSWYGKQT